MSQVLNPSDNRRFLVSVQGKKQYFKHKVSAQMAYQCAHGYVSLWSAAGSGWHLEQSKGGPIKV